MKLRIDKEKTRRARVLAHEVDKFSHEISDRLSDADFEALQRSSQVMNRIAKERVVEVQL